ncbi:MAG: hypothetical protein M1838_005743, partial [Thelocarpon superellum]
NEYLMHAVLTMAASHLRYLKPDDPTERQAELHHVSQALHGLRSALSAPLSESNASTLISSSLLLFHHAWTCLDFQNPLDEHHLDLGMDHLFALSTGLRRVLLATMPMRDIYFFQPMLCHRPTSTIRQYSERTTFPVELEAFFVDCYWGTSSPDASDEDFSAYMDAAIRLIPALSILKQTRGLVELPELWTDMGRLLFSWPVKCEAGLVESTRRNDRTAQILLLLFYLTVSKLLPESFWWAQKRSDYFCRAMFATLTDGNAGVDSQYTKWARDIYDGKL